MRTAWTGSMAAAVAGFYYAARLPLNHDSAWFLFMAREVLGGARLYRDVIDINPPLIVWLSLPAVLLERVTGWHHTTTFIVLVGMAAGVSVISSYRLARHAADENARPILLVVCTLVMFVLPAREWGQREHLMVIMALPYVLACAARVRGIAPNGAVPIGLFAGLGLALKPHFLLAFVGLETWVHLSRPRVWSGTIVVAGTLALYAALTVMVTEYIPLALSLSDVYGSFSPTPISGILTQPKVVIAVAVLAFVRLGGPGRELRQAFGIATAAWLLAYVIQRKGFDYHFIPVLSGAVLIIAATALLASSRKQSLAAAMFAAFALSTIPLIAAPPTRDVRWQQIRETAGLAGQSPVVALTPFMLSAWPHISYANADWRAPTHSTWAMGTTSRGEQLAVEWMLPAVQAGVNVLVPADPARSSLPLLMTDPRFRAAWSRYSRVAQGSYWELHSAGR